MIDESVLQEFGAYKAEYAKDAMVFHEGEEALAYYQVYQGLVKMVSYSDEGKAFIQGFFSTGESFGEPPLFGKFPYPASAITVDRSWVWKLTRGNFLELLKNRFDIHLMFDEVLSKRLHYKATVLKNLSQSNPEERILNLIDYYKAFEVDLNEPYAFKVPFTRQQLADMTGLRVETVIRTIKSLEESGELKIARHKVYR